MNISKLDAWLVHALSSSEKGEQVDVLVQAVRPPTPAEIEALWQQGVNLTGRGRVLSARLDARGAELLSRETWVLHIELSHPLNPLAP